MQRGLVDADSEIAREDLRLGGGRRLEERERLVGVSGDDDVVEVLDVVVGGDIDAYGRCASSRVPASRDAVVRPSDLVMASTYSRDPPRTVRHWGRSRMPSRP